MSTPKPDLAFDDYKNESYPDNLYTVGAVATPVHGFDAVTDADIARYERDGFLAIDPAFSQAETDAARDGLMDLINGKKAGFDGLIFEKWAEGKLTGLSPAERQDAVRKLVKFTSYDERLHRLERHPQLQGLVERLLGNPPELFQEMALLKPPRGREKPWHQDLAYFNYRLDAKVVGVWIALDTVTVENGCMHVLSGEHRRGPRLHFMRRDWQICDTEMVGQRCTAVPLNAGGCMLFHALLPHGTPTNRSTLRRRAVQFHYAAANAEKLPPEARLQTFGSEGKNVTC